MNKIVRELQDHGVVGYLNNILHYSIWKEGHINWVQEVSDRLAKYLIAVSVTKLVFPGNSFSVARIYHSHKSDHHE